MAADYEIPDPSSCQPERVVDAEWVATERSDSAEAALFREYQYHRLRAAELALFLENRGFRVD
jgi:hypothetical protein